MLHLTYKNLNLYKKGGEASLGGVRLELCDSKVRIS